MTFNNWSHEKWLDFLTDNYHLLSRLTKVDPFLPWLRQKKVLLEDDEEEINCRNTSALRSAKLIDTIKYKGIKGAEAYMEVVEWVYPEVYSTISGKSARPPPDEFKCNKEEVGSFRKSRILLDQLQKCMGSILEENNWKREDIIQLRETVQNLRLENERMMEDMNIIRKKWERSIEDAEELKLQNIELQTNLERQKEDNVRQSLKLDNLFKENTNIMVCRKDKMNSIDAKEKPDQYNSELQSRCKCLENNLTKLEQALMEKRTESERQRREIDQLLDLNQRLKNDYHKAVKTSQIQQETLDLFKEENEKSSQAGENEKSDSQTSPDILKPTKLIRKPVVKTKNSSPPQLPQTL